MDREAYRAWSASEHGSWVRALAGNVMDGRRGYDEAAGMIRESGTGANSSAVPAGGVEFGLTFLASMVQMDAAGVRAMGQGL